MNSIKAALIQFIAFAILSQQALAGGPACRWVHDDVRLTAIEQSTNRYGALQIPLWKRILTRPEIAEFDVPTYMSWRRDLLTEQKSTEQVFKDNSFEAKLALLDTVNILSREHFLKQEISASIENMGLYRQRTLGKLIKKWNLTDPVDQISLSQFSQDLFWTLRGAQVKNLDYLTKKPSTRAQAQMEHLLHEQILSYGLKGLVAELPGLPKSLKNSLRVGLTKVWRFPLFRAFALTKLSLPELNNVKISEELISKIMLNGIEPYRQELQAQTHPQLRRNMYEFLRGKIGPIAIVALSLHLSLSVSETGQFRDLTPSEKEQVLIIERETREALVISEQTMSEMRKEGQRVRYEATLTVLKDKWMGRNPTQEELGYLIQKIWQDSATPTVIERVLALRPEQNTTADHQFLAGLSSTMEATIRTEVAP